MHLKTLTPERRVSESGLRYYRPELGRWPSRDPIFELGFLTLREAEMNFDIEPIALEEEAQDLAYLNRIRASTDLLSRAIEWGANDRTLQMIVGIPEPRIVGSAREEEMNLYAFVLNSPIEHVDSLGNDIFCFCNTVVLTIMPGPCAVCERKIVRSPGTCLPRKPAYKCFCGMPCWDFSLYHCRKLKRLGPSWVRVGGKKTPCP